MSSVSEGATLATVPVQPHAPVRRNVPLLVGLGCFGLIVAASLLMVSVTLGAIVVGIRSSDAFKLAVAAAQRDPTIAAELGAPVEAGWVTPGRIEVSGPTGHADLAIPLSGPSGSATLYVLADKSAGKWTFKTLRADVAGRTAPIDLLTTTRAP